MNTEVSTFKHLQSAHCESGVAASLLTHQGQVLSEPMAFGIGSGLFFAHLPFVKIMGLPLTSFRSYPGTILKKVFKRTGIRLQKRTFRSEEKALKALDEMIDQGIPAGVQLSVFWLPYLPPQFRFQFNAHHAIICGKKDNEYIVSDPIGEEKVLCPVDDFRRAWFAQGPLAPNGALYTASGSSTATKEDLIPAIKSALKETTNRMLRVPVPYFGIHGISLLSRRMKKWPDLLKNDRQIKLNLGQIVRMQEEIGTGGAGFRFLYAAFLEEAATLLKSSSLKDASDRMTLAGDNWRKFAVSCAKTCKAEDFSKAKLKELSEIIEHSRQLEEQVFRLIEK